MEILKIVLAENDLDDRDIFLDCAATLNDIEIMAVATTPDETAEAVKDLSPQVLLLDLGLKYNEDLAVVTLRLLRDMRLKNVPYIIIPTFQADETVLDTARKYGADYICQKYDNVEEWQRMALDTARAFQSTAHRKWEYTGQRWKSEEEFADDQNRKITEELDKVGISKRDTTARELLTEAILLTMEAPQPHLYFTLSEKHDCTEAEIVKTMEKAIHRAWRSVFISSGDPAHNYHGKVNIYTGIPAVTQFITYYADKIKEA